MFSSSLLATLFLAQPSQACAPPQPQALITAPPESLLVAPVADLGRELARIAPTSRYEASARSAIDEELARLIPLGVSREGWRAWRMGLSEDRPTLPAGVDRAFVLYAEAAVRWRRGDHEDAARQLQALLALPEAERRDRTLWATFMLARHNGRQEDFDQVLALVDAGAPDPLGLAAASLGEKARVHLWSRDWRAAVDLYLEQLSSGDPRAVQSIGLVVRQAMEADALRAWASDPVLARVATAWILSRGGPLDGPVVEEETRDWLAAVQVEGLTLQEADRLAWLHYQVGDVGGTEAWLDRAAPTPLVHWLRGRLLLRAGRIAEAEAALALAATGFSPDERWFSGSVPGRERWEGIVPAEEAWADAGMARLALQDWSGALRAFLGAGSWQDSAYVAERILDLPDACAVAAPLPGLPLPAAMLDDDGWGRLVPEDAVSFERPQPTTAATDLRYLLARRALRQGAPVDVSDFPAIYQADVRRYQEALRRGEEALTPGGRARGLWQAAVIARRRGLEILGTELEPDYGAAAADFEVYPPTAERFTLPAGPLAPSAEEEARWRASAPDPDQRFHYRFTAAALAKRAADLLADDDPDVGVLLCRAGSWVRGRDPALADSYSMEAVRRTGRWPGRCGDPTFGGVEDARRFSQVLAAALGLAGLALWAGGRRDPR